MSWLQVWWRKLRPSGFSREPRLVPEPLEVDAQKSPGQGSPEPERISILTESSRATAERVRRQILLLLDLQVVQKEPQRVCEIIARLANAAVRQDLEGIARLELQIERLRQDDLQYLAHQLLSLKTFVAQEIIKAWLHQSIPVMIRCLKGDPSAQRDLDDEFTHLETLLAIRARGQSNPQSVLNILVLVRNRLHRVMLSFQDKSVLTRDLVENAIRNAVEEVASQIPEISWSLGLGSDLTGRTGFGEPYRPMSDLSLHSSLRETIEATAHALEEAKRHAIEIENSNLIVRKEFFSALHDRLASFKLAPSPTSTDNWMSALKTLLTETMAKNDPDLTVHLAGILSQNQGALSWDACLELANSRIRVHRYTTVDKDIVWHVGVNVRPGPDGTIDIPFAVIEQPLSSKFKSFFEDQDLLGRVRILWELVHFASTLQTSIISITAADAHRQVQLRQEDLWQAFNRPWRHSSKL